MSKNLVIVILVVVIAILGGLLFSKKQVSFNGSNSQAAGGRQDNQKYYDSVKDKCVGDYRIRNIGGNWQCVDGKGNWVLFPSIQ